MDENKISDYDLQLLVDELYQKYGYDFSNYATSSLKRRATRLMTIGRFSGFTEMLYKIKSDPTYLTEVIQELTVNVTEMFRDPEVFKKIREQILPILGTHPIIRIWHAGCSSGEEVYSMAILLHEAGLLKKSLLYATDLNPSVIEKVSKGIFPLKYMKQFSENYYLAGGKKDFSNYYTTKYDLAKFNNDLSAKVISATHNLVSDRSFNEFQLIFCRNVLIYFDKILQNKVLNLFDGSLEKHGYLVLGSKESLRFSEINTKYIQLDNKEKIWKKT